jgi:hypothetical protein
MDWSTADIIKRVTSCPSCDKERIAELEAENNTACEHVLELLDKNKALREALGEAIEWNWMDADAPISLANKIEALLQGKD